MEEQQGEIKYRKYALRSIRSIHETISKDSARRADNFQDELKAFISTLIHFAEKYPECKELPTKKCLYRSAAFRKYRVIYKIVPQGIEIIEVFHTKRSPRSLARLRRVK